ncbi:uncharacterized protein LY89DRAFT_782764 [Mollisia scopiformis]|uniref:2EXR domain-containing protein n=1 Tax=Mollisia scopiformis TaxID=149040 RepID=A0A194X8L9_MOLSC|nr:uncharacterized protein LY89DRAFT_782764 [Mollisia scopiformis]KUJ16516.1 hypothetical protein LY89DRAFT_782764 [Mollisia scopiformis]
MVFKKAAPSFTNFPKLPTEIRIKIWEEASYLPRNVDIWPDRSESVPGEWWDPLYAGGKQTLRACFGFKSTLEHDVQISVPHRIYVNWKSDTVFPVPLGDSDWHTDLLERPEISKVAMNIAEKCYHFKILRPSLEEAILYYLDPLMDQDALSSYFDHFEVSFRPFNRRGPPKRLRELFDLNKAYIETDYEVMIENEARKRLPDNHIILNAEDDVERNRALELEKEKLRLLHPIPVVRYMRLFLNGKDSSNIQNRYLSSAPQIVG